METPATSQPSPSQQSLPLAPLPAHSQRTQFALYAALQTMKKRCLTLQQRLIGVEDENLALRQRTIPAPNASPAGRGRSCLLAEREREQLVYDLQMQVQQLAQTRQQATDRLTMVAAENRHLWARLSLLTKAQSPLLLAEPLDADTSLLDYDQLITTLIGPHSPKVVETAVAVAQATSPNPNLIRSKTFTQNGPNPTLRERMPAVEVDVTTTAQQRRRHQPVSSFADEDLSLEEISLKVLNEFMEKNTIAEQLCGEMAAEVMHEAATSDDTAAAEAAADSFGFGFLSENETVEVAANGSGDGSDLQAELKRCADGMADIRKEVLCQQSDIKVALSRLRQRRCECEL